MPVCCYGEAASLWEWFDDPVVKVERKAAQKKLDQEILEMGDAEWLTIMAILTPRSSTLTY